MEVQFQLPIPRDGSQRRKRNPLGGQKGSRTIPKGL